MTNHVVGVTGGQFAHEGHGNASRARVVAAADQARRRIEQDLHDGAQQPLVALKVQLRAAKAAVPPELGELGAELDRAAAVATGALDELREIARGIHSAVLSRGGLRLALKALARRSPVRVDLQVRAGRLPEPVEISAYYIVAEALTNTAKYARASAVGVEAEVVGDLLRVTVRDNGVGGADLAGGTGLAGLKDRVEALGGRMVLHSPAGRVPACTRSSPSPLRITALPPARPSPETARNDPC